MTAIRLIVQSNPADADARAPDLVKFSAAVRQEPGCLQAEDFRGTEFSEDLLHIELWESPAAFDAHWQRALAEGQRAMLAELLALQAPYRFGSPQSPRRHGQNGIELYEHRYFTLHNQVWARLEESERSAYLRWPAWGAVRILIQNTSDPNADPSRKVQTALETRHEKGCDQFENFRGIEFPENTVAMETWTTPEIYDIHWLNRLLQQRRAATQPPPPQPTPVERRYGRPGFEWYSLCYYTVLNDVWMPEDPARRMLTVQW